MLKKILAVVAVLVVAAGAALWVAFRLHFSDPSRTPYCRVLTCETLDGYDTLCALLAQAEFQGHQDAADQRRWLTAEAGQTEAADHVRALLAESLARPPDQRYTALLEAVRAAGAPGWACPAAERVLPTL